MKQVCCFDKSRDLGEVVPGLAIDLEKAIETGVVLDTGTVEAHNDIATPESVVCRVRDTFHALELQKAYLEAGKITQSSGLSGSNEHSSVSVSQGAAAPAGE